MTRNRTVFIIRGGPSKHSLMLSLFDTDMGMRMVKFHLPEWDHTYDTHDVSVTIISAKRLNLNATSWDLEGIAETPNNYRVSARVFIRYFSDIREGSLMFEEKKC